MKRKIAAALLTVVGVALNLTGYALIGAGLGHELTILGVTL